MIRKLYFSIILICSVFAGCSEKSDNKALLRVGQLSDSDPKAAMAALDSIDYAALTERDRHLYDFLSIKTNDKNYNKHTSDSLILDVIDYVSSHKEDGYYAEALYYGGRVYSDLGDSHTALLYFQKALSHLPKDTDMQGLRCRVCSQTGRLLTSLRLYDEAIPFIQSALEIDRQSNDTTNIIYDLQLLGGTYLRAEDYTSAEKYFNESLELCPNQPAFLSATSRMYLAEVKRLTGQNDYALNLIRDTPDAVKPISRNSALAYAAKIYLEAGILDTATAIHARFCAIRI